MYHVFASMKIDYFAVQVLNEFYNLQYSYPPIPIPIATNQKERDFNEKSLNSCNHNWCLICHAINTYLFAYTGVQFPLHLSATQTKEFSFK